jgi:hypothetical protein
MTDVFDPKNALEEALLAAQEGRIELEAFVDALMQSQVFMPVEDKYQIAGLQTSDMAQPLVLEDESGVRVVVLFTSPERAKPFLADHPPYKGGLLAEFPWVLERLIGGEVGISLNPGCAAGIDMEPSMLRDLFAGR